MGGIALLGAGGFVGARVLELATFEGRAVVPIVRAYRSVARSANLGIPHRLGDAADPASLAKAIAGCDVVVNVTMGDASEILRNTRGIHDAAVEAGARLLIHLSSATVYGGIERPDLADDAPPRLDHWMPYARQKGLAENYLRERMTERTMSIVVLRPGLIWGPGSPWVLAPGRELIRGSAYLVGDGSGVCNLMYVDDLVRSIFAIADHAAPASGFYNVADDVTLTWRDYYTALGAELGVDVSTVHRLPAGPYRGGLRERLAGLKETSLYRRMKEGLPLEMRTSLKLRAARLRRPADPDADTRPAVTRTMWELQRTRFRLPTEKFRAKYGEQDRTATAHALAASAEWLRFIGVDERRQLAHIPAAPPKGS